MGETKKGSELAELKGQLRSLAASQSKEDLAAKHELLKKVISYMSLSIDVSSLFTEMTMATATSNVATKKMLYHYITHHAHMYPELALLAINTLLKVRSCSPKKKEEGGGIVPGLDRGQTLCGCRYI